MLFNGGLNDLLTFLCFVLFVVVVRERGDVMYGLAADQNTLKTVLSCNIAFML